MWLSVTLRRSRGQADEGWTGPPAWSFLGCKPLAAASRQGGSRVQETIRVDRKATGPDNCQVAVSGELDLVTAAEVREALQGAVGENRVVVIDLGGLTFCDCTGLSALPAAARTAQAGDVELRLCAVSHFLAASCGCLAHTVRSASEARPDIERGLDQHYRHPLPRRSPRPGLQVGERSRYRRLGATGREGRLRSCRRTAGGSLRWHGRGG
ncbi:STAS domain-containing protein [Streptomyces sp. NBS 14/10]|uniref:STAS domain-containing protein n=1 Tax=Streptomyces sp. NBS 14/10 TaxID=1945643 RepID=UPI000B801849